MSGAEGKVGNQYLKLKYKFVLSKPTPRLIHPFPTRIYSWHKEISLNTFTLQHIFENLTVAKPNKVQGVRKISKN